MTKEHFIDNFDKIIADIEYPKMSSYDEYLHLMYNHYSPKKEVNKAFKDLDWIRSEDIVLLIKLKKKEHLFEDIL